MIYRRTGARYVDASAAGLVLNGVVVAGFGVITLALYVGGFDQDKAYLMSTTRAWQLAFGGLLGLAGASLTLPRRIRLPAGWLGLALIASCGFVLDGAALFPGLWSLWPLLGLTLVGLNFVTGVAVASAIGVLMMILGALTLVPALLSMAGTRIDRLREWAAQRRTS